MSEEQIIGVSCPKCGNHIEFRLSWLKSHDTFNCAGCRVDFIINHEKLLAGMEKAEQAIAKFR